MESYYLKSIIGEIAKGIGELIDRKIIRKNRKVLLYGLDRYAFAMRTILSNLGYHNIEGYISEDETLVLRHQTDIKNFACRFLNHETDVIHVWTVRERLQPPDQEALILFAVKASDYVRKKAELEALGYEENVHFYNTYDFEEKELDAFFEKKSRMSLDEIKQMEKEILIYVDRLCRKHGLRYWVCGGTLLGTIRHKGFIPWDDDIDLFLPWQDYLKFIEVFEETPRFSMLGFGTAEVNDFPDPFAKVVDKRTMIHEDIGTLWKRNPLFVDVFPLVGLPEDETERRRFFADYQELNRQIWQDFYASNGKTDIFPKWFESQKSFFTKYDFDTASYVGVLGTAYKDRDCTTRKVYDDTLRMRFEDTEVNVPAGYQEYLDNLYGKDWMRIPDESRRKTHHHIMSFWNENRRKYLLFGSGEYYARYKIWFERKDIVALADNAGEKQGHAIDGIPVIPPEAVLHYDFDAVVILSFYVREMKAQLVELGVPEDKIYHFFDLHDLLRVPSLKKEIRYHGWDIRDCKNGNKNSVLLLSQDMTLGGPALALYHAARVLKKRGYQVVYGSMMDGPLRKTLIADGIPVVVDVNLMIGTMRECEWVWNFSLIICNTMNFHVFLSERIREIPVAWWLHDALFFYGGVKQGVMDRIATENMKIWSVGPIPEKAVKTFRPDFRVENLLYGVEDKVNPGAASEAAGTDRKRCTVIGYMEYRKGQDILLEAIWNLEPSVRQKAEFCFVGQNNSPMAKKMIRTAENIPEVVITGPVGREEINHILDHTDLLICPSREDPMPTVAAEAMMHGVPCLISDAAGTARYITNGMDGIVFESENVELLRDMLEKFIRDQFDLVQMGKHARTLFEKYFSMEAFEERFMGLVEDMLCQGL